jgi:hypothetical protein
MKVSEVRTSGLLQSLCGAVIADSYPSSARKKPLLE